MAKIAKIFPAGRKTMKVIFYVSVGDLDRLAQGEAVRAMESETRDFYRVEAEIGEVEIYQDPDVSTRRLAKKVVNNASATNVVAA